MEESTAIRGLFQDIFEPLGFLGSMKEICDRI
jgi:hypothetical protein